MKRKVCVLVLICLWYQIFAQQEQATQVIRGKVIDAVTQYPLTGALVSVQGNTVLASLTNSYGVFEITGVPIGRQSIEVSYLGYKTKVIENVLVITGKQFVLDIALEDDPIQIAQVVVQSNAHKTSLNEMAVVSSRAISVEQTERFAGSLGDPARMVANYAGVSSKDDSRNDIVIRGNSPSGVLWRLNGIEIPNPNHFGALGATGGPVSMINNNLLTTSDFMTGAFPAEYGNALAGAFDLYLRQGNTQKHEFTGQVGFNGFELGAEGPLTNKQTQNASYLINCRYSTLDVMHKLGVSMGTGAAIPQYKDVTYNVVVPTEKYGKFSFFGLWGNSFIRLGRAAADTSENSYNARGTATDFGSGLGAYGLGHTYYINPKTRIRTTVSFQNMYVTTVFDSVKKTGVEPVFRQRQNQNKISINQQFTNKFSSKSNIKLGYSYDMYAINFADSIYLAQFDTYRKGVDVKGDFGLLQAYIQNQCKPFESFTCNIGVHSQIFSLNNQVVVEPRLGLEYAIAKNHVISFGYGIHNKTQPHEVYFQQFYDSITQTYYKPNTNLKFTQNTHYILGYNTRMFDVWKCKLELYYQYIQHAPVSNAYPSYSMLNAGADFTVPRIENLVNKGTGSNKGVEITIERVLEHGFYVLVTTSLFDSKYTDYNGKERNTAFNGNYIINALSGYEITIKNNKMLTLDLRTVYAGGKRYIPIDIEASKQANDMVYNWNSIYEKKYKPYFRTDLRIGYKVNGKKITQEWGLDLQNITNYKSIFMEAYDAQKQEVYYLYQQGFMPMMLYRINF